MSADLLALFRLSALRYLPDRATIERETLSTGAYGESVRAWTLIAQDVPCRLVTARRSDLSAVGIRTERETMEQVYRVAMPHDTPLSGADRLLINGAVYHVIRIEPALTDRVFMTAIAARR